MLQAQANPAQSCMQIAKRQAVVNPENTFFSVKRFIGRKVGWCEGLATILWWLARSARTAWPGMCPGM